jgi:hypothetical protein
MTVPLARILRLGASIVAIAVLATLGIAALYPVDLGAREETFAIPKGTWARRMAGDPVEILPSTIYLTLELRDVLLLKNLDDVPQVFGPTLIMPGQSFRLPFTEASENLFNCTAHANGQLIVIVDEAPTSPWTRLTWRARRLVRRLSRSS